MPPHTRAYPPIRPRSMLDDSAARVLSPDYPSPGETTMSEAVIIPANATTRITILTPNTKRRIRLIEVSIFQPISDAVRWFELYFGTGANITANKASAIDIFKVPQDSADSTARWGRGRGPVGAVNEVLSLRTITAAVGQGHTILIEYTEER